MPIDFNLEGEIFRGVSWLSLARLLNRGFVFLATVFLARILSPTEFGLVASAVVVFNLLAVFNESGIDAAIIQRKEEVDGDVLSTIFWPNLAFGFLSFALAYLASPLVAEFFGDPQVRPIFVGLSLILIFDSLGLVQSAYLTRTMRFKELSLNEIIASLGFGLVAVGGALSGLKAWSLVWGYLAKSLINSALLWFRVSWRPTAVFKLDVFLRIYGFGVRVIGNGLVDFLRRNIDQALIGSFLGVESLGIYSLAHNLVVLFRDQLTPLVTRAALPVYARLQDDHQGLVVTSTKVAKYLAFVVLPISFGVAAVAPEAVRIFFGRNWEGAIVPLQYLSVAGALLSINPVIEHALIAKGQPGRVVLWKFLGSIVMAAFVYWGVLSGSIQRVALAFLLAVLVETPVSQAIFVRFIGGNFLKLWRNLAPVFLAAGLMLAIVSGLRVLLMEVSVPEPVVLASSVISGAVSYLLTLRLVDAPLFLGVWGGIRAKFR